MMRAPQKNLLLLSGSRVGDKNKPGGGFLEFAEPMIKEHFKDAIAEHKPVLFIPYAMPHPFTREAEYVALVKETFAKFGIEMIAPKEGEDARPLLERAAGVFIGGGNTYRLLDTLQQNGMLEAIRAKVNAGLPYMGSSAGTIIACPTIATTNDMHSRLPQSLDSLNLIPFQLNCHYMDDHMFHAEHNGENRSTRLAEYLRENRDQTVLGIREGSALKVRGDKIYLLGDKPARLFKYGKDPVELDGQGGTKDLAKSLAYQRADFGPSQ